MSAAVRLTHRGRSLLAGAGALVVLARLFASVELAGLAAAGGLAVVAAYVGLRSTAVVYQAARRLDSARVPVGTSARVRLTFTNPTRRRARYAVAADDAVMDGSARCLVAPLGPGQRAEVEYVVPASRRGTFLIGPLRTAVSDPLGLAELAATVPGRHRLVVHPRTEDVEPPPSRTGAEAHRGALRRAALLRGEDFYALREYEVGDDLRRVHWRTTAKTGELMLRQDELRRDDVAMLLLDLRDRVHTAASFERALEVAASLTTAAVRAARRMRVVATGGYEADLIDAGRLVTVLDFLAGVQPQAGDGFAAVQRRARREARGPLVAVTGAASPAELAGLGALGAHLGLVMVAVVGSARTAPGAVTVPIPLDSSFAPVWNQAVLACENTATLR